MADTIVWISEANRGIHGYRFSTFPNDGDPVIVVDTNDGLLWRFQFENRRGNGAIVVGAGCRYDPLSMIESLWAGFEDGKFSDMTPAAHIKLDETAFNDPNWAKMLSEQLERDGDDLL